MDLNKKLPLEDMEILLELVDSEEYKLLLKYIKLLHKQQEEALINATDNKDVVYSLYGELNGSKKLLNSILDFKSFLKDKTRTSSQD